MSGLSIGPIAIAIGVVGYVLKRWWDNSDQIVRERQLKYSEYFAVCYQIAQRLMHDPEDPEREEIRGLYQNFQQATPVFQIIASPRAILASENFYNHLRHFIDADRNTWTEDKKQTLTTAFSQALGYLREVLKEEMYSSQPRFVWERIVFQRKLKKNQSLVEKSQQSHNEKDEA